MYSVFTINWTRITFCQSTDYGVYVVTSRFADKTRTFVVFLRGEMSYARVMTLSSRSTVQRSFEWHVSPPRPDRENGEKCVQLEETERISRVQRMAFKWTFLGCCGRPERQIAHPNRVGVDRVTLGGNVTKIQGHGRNDRSRLWAFWTFNFHSFGVETYFTKSWNRLIELNLTDSTKRTRRVFLDRKEMALYAKIVYITSKCRSVGSQWIISNRPAQIKIDRLRCSRLILFFYFVKFSNANHD